MHSSGNFLRLLSFAVAVYGQSQVLKSELSFGHDARISNDMVRVPHFNILGEPLAPQVLSNKIILTPPAPGNQRAAVWSEDTLKYSAWEMDIEFRTSGPERGGGKFTVWLAKNAQQAVGTSSIYTVGKFEGLAIVLDNYGGMGGVIRGFLNDGNIDYKSHHSVDSVAFGHCSYAYRNLGRLTQLKISQDHNRFKVEVDGRLCFETDKVKIPINYNIGVTAVSAETPDSFEINALKVIAHTYNFEAGNQPPASEQAPQSPLKPRPGESLYSFLGQSSPLDGGPPAVEASKVPDEEQFADIHNRLQALHQHIAGNHQEFSATMRIISEHLQNMETPVRSRGEPPNPMNDIKQLKEKLETMEIRMQHIQNAVGDKWHIEDLKRTVEESHNNLLKRAPGLGTLVLIIVGSQAVLVALYVVYKRRRVSGSKKYL